MSLSDCTKGYPIVYWRSELSSIVLFPQNAVTSAFPAPASSMNLDLSLASARLSNFSFSSPTNNGGGGGSLGTGALANGSTMGELLNASVSGASHTLMADAGKGARTFGTGT